MPRRRPAQLRTATLSSLRPRGDTALIRMWPSSDGYPDISHVPGLSPHGRVVLAGLERTRLSPGRTASALRHWRHFVRDPYHRLWDPRYEGCGIWECCPDMHEVRRILEIVARALPRRDARRFRAVLDALDADW
ncbi:hypothetical protein [Nocardia sp. NPDC050710]|uniref:hypothetical protein n=1 Tax=Nocardia sp. NPDC050710 TaxID=3157220 RepID=UPI003408E495